MVVETATHTIVHYEIPAQDAEKLSAFYSSVFGWQFAGSQMMGSYRMASTGNGRDGAGIAIFPREEAGEGARPTNYIAVESIGAYAEKVEQAGGRVLHQFTIPGMGYGAIAVDPENNALGLWQADSSARPAA